MIFKKKEPATPPTAEERDLLVRIDKAYRKLFPWTLLNLFPGVLIGLFTWYYYFYVILGEHIIWKQEGIENILGFLLLYIAPLFSILGLISISVTIIARFTYRKQIAKHFYEERKVNDRLWNTSVVISICTTVITLLIRCLF